MRDTRLKARTSIILLCRYFIGYLYAYPKLTVAVIRLFPNPADWLQNTAAAVFYLLYFLDTVLLCRTYLRRSWKNFQNDPRTTLMQILLYEGSIILAGILFNLTVRSAAGLGTSANQAAVSKAFRQQPWISLPMAILFAPVVEELTFRAAVIDPLIEKAGPRTACILSACLFGLIHVSDSLLAGNWADGLYFLLYAALGYLLSRIYVRRGNIFASIGLHGFNNLLGILSSLI